MWKAIIKRPHEEATEIELSWKKIQSLICGLQGLVQHVPMPDGTYLLCDEEGIMKNLEPNVFLPKFVQGGYVRGNVIILGQKHSDFASLTDEQMKYWKELLNRKGVAL